MDNAMMFGPATLSVTQSIGAFTTFLPNFAEIRRAHPDTDPAVAADVRMGEIAAVTTSLGIGIICSSLTGNALPAYTALVTSLVLVTLYETTLRSNRPCEPTAARITNLGN